MFANYKDVAIVNFMLKTPINPVVYWLVAWRHDFSVREHSRICALPELKQSEIPVRTCEVRCRNSKIEYVWTLL